MRPVASMVDLVYYPDCGIYPIITGGPWINTYRPIAHIFDLVAVPGGGAIITGDPMLLDAYRPVARIGDLAASIDCGFGIIITGTPNFLDL